MIRFSNRTIEDYCSEIAQNTCFSVARYGDGEIRWINGWEGTNCDGHDYFKEGSAELRQTLLVNPRHRIATTPKYAHPKKQHYMQPFIEWLQSNCLMDLVWDDHGIFSESLMNSAKDGVVWPMIKELRKKPVILVGPRYLTTIKLFDYDFVEVPSKNCYLEKERIIAGILKTLGCRTSVVIVLCCCYTANLIVSELFPVIGDDNWLIDVGAVLDPYAGVASRPGYVLKNQLRLKQINARCTHSE